MSSFKLLRIYKNEYKNENLLVFEIRADRTNTSVVPHV